MGGAAAEASGAHVAAGAGAGRPASGGSWVELPSEKDKGSTSPHEPPPPLAGAGAGLDASGGGGSGGMAAGPAADATARLAAGSRASAADPVETEALERIFSLDGVPGGEKWRGGAVDEGLKKTVRKLFWDLRQKLDGSVEPDEDGGGGHLVRELWEKHGCKRRKIEAGDGSAAASDPDATPLALPVSKVKMTLEIAAKNPAVLAMASAQESMEVEGTVASAVDQWRPGSISAP